MTRLQAFEHHFNSDKPNFHDLLMEVSRFTFSPTSGSDTLIIYHSADRRTVFEGRGLTYDSSTGELTSGTVTRLAQGTFESLTAAPPRWGDYNLRLEDVSIAARGLSAAAQTASNADDVALLASALSGNDTMLLSFGSYLVRGFDGNDVISAIEAGATFYGGRGNDHLTSGEAGGELYGGAGNDILENYDITSSDVGGELYGGAGNDILSIHDSNLSGHVADGGRGVDRLALPLASDGSSVALVASAGGVLVNGVAFGARFETFDLTGGSGDDAIRGGDGNDRLDGMSGADRLFGGKGADTLTFRGSPFTNDVADGGAGADLLQLVCDPGSPQSLTVVVSGNEVAVNGMRLGTRIEKVDLSAGAASDVLRSGAGRDVLDGGGGADRLDGGDGDDRLLGGPGVDRLFGRKGSDHLVGGAGEDRLTGGWGNDVFEYTRPRPQKDVITDFHRASGDNDLFHISARGFGGGLDAGETLAASQFQIRADKLAQDADDRFIFRTTDKTLWFDSNGKASGGRTLVADLQADATVTYDDILLV